MWAIAVDLDPTAIAWRCDESQLQFLGSRQFDKDKRKAVFLHLGIMSRGANKTSHG